MKKTNKKNVIEFVLDCGAYGRIVDSLEHPSPMPFLNSIKNTGIWCTKAYSQGPYTEAAIMGLTFGKDTLNDNGYFDSFYKWKDSIYEVFKKNGYDVFTTYSYSVMPLNIKKECFYSDAMNKGKPFFSRFIKSKLDYYYNIKKHSFITENDYLIISSFINYILDIMIDYCTEQTITQHDYTIYSAFQNREKEQIDKINKWRNLVILEKQKYLSNRINYCKELMDNYVSHFLTNKCDLFSQPFKESVCKNRILLKNNKIWYKILLKKSFRYITDTSNVLSFKIYVKDLFSNNPLKRRRSVEFFIRFIKACFLIRKKKMTQNNLDQLLPCARNDIESFFHWLDNKKHCTPFFSYIHVDDYHGDTSFCSYDTDDANLLISELNDSSGFIDNIKMKYRGDILKDLSLYYLDQCIKYLYNGIKDRNLLKNTIIIITADHGCTNSGGQFRYTNTNNFYDEQYHIPLLFLNINKSGIIDKFVNSKDIPLAIFDLCNIKAPLSYTGKSIFKNEGRDFTYVEYMGPGIPDLQRKAVLFNYRNTKISYTISVKIFENSYDLLEFYDLIDDPFEIRNIYKEKQGLLDELVKPFHIRIEEIKLNYNAYLDSLKENFYE